MKKHTQGDPLTSCQERQLNKRREDTTPLQRAIRDKSIGTHSMLRQITWQNQSKQKGQCINDQDVKDVMRASKPRKGAASITSSMKTDSDMRRPE